MGWTDGKSQRIEDVLNEVVVSLVAVARIDHQWQLDREAAHKRQIAIEAARRVEEEREKERLKHVAELEQLADNRAKAEEIRGLLQAMKKRVDHEEQNEDLRKWFAWAAAYADSIDPLRKELRLSPPREFA